MQPSFCEGSCWYCLVSEAGGIVTQDIFNLYHFYQLNFNVMKVKKIFKLGIVKLLRFIEKLLTCQNHVRFGPGVAMLTLMVAKLTHYHLFYSIFLVMCSAWTLVTFVFIIDYAIEGKTRPQIKRKSNQLKHHS